MAPSTSMRSVAFVIFATFALNVIKPQVALGQNADPQRNGCSSSEILKPTKTVSGTYTEEATKKNVEGTVAVCDGGWEWKSNRC
jgi:hypothetical protein